MRTADLVFRMPAILLAAAALLTASCRDETGESVSEYPEKLRLADQYGLAYAPAAAARLQGWFEEELPGVDLEWATLGNAAAIREAILAGRLDGGSMGIPPYLIGRDRGMDWLAVGAVSRARLGLTTTREGITGLADLPADTRIAVPQPGSIQHILLAMASDREFGDAARYDASLVTLSHPDGMNALMAGADVAAHFTSPPFLQREMAAGAALVLDGDEAFGGEYTFIVAVLAGDVIEQYPAAAAGVRRAIARGARWLEENPAEAADLLAGHFRMEREELRDFLESDDLAFGGEILGMERFVSFMAGRGYLERHHDEEDLVY